MSNFGDAGALDQMTIYLGFISSLRTSAMVMIYRSIEGENDFLKPKKSRF